MAASPEAIRLPDRRFHAPEGSFEMIRENLRAAALLTLAMLLFAMEDTLIKLLASELQRLALEPDLRDAQMDTVAEEQRLNADPPRGASFSEKT